MQAMRLWLAALALITLIVVVGAVVKIWRGRRRAWLAALALITIVLSVAGVVVIVRSVGA